MEAEVYTYLKYFEMLRMVEGESFAHIQGRPVVIVYSSHFTEEFLQSFFKRTFSVLSKIVLEKSGKHYLVCDKYEKECIEPFDGLLTVVNETDNNVEKIIAYILT